VTIQNKQVKLGSARRIGASALVRSLSGRPAGYQSRRGATLILIIGALALLSVVVLSYFLIGKGDRRLASAAVRKEGVDSVVARVGEYIAKDIIAADVFSMYVEGENPDINDRYAYLVREAWDHPWTDPERRSVPTALPGTALYDRQRFDAIGTVAKSFDPQFGPNMSVILAFPGSDPFLASTSATWINPELDAPRYDPGNSDNWLENARDLAQISNIAPDGRYVNLYNLRGNFAAESGFGLDGNNRPRISEGLTLLDNLGQPTLDLDYGGTADPNIPAHWGTRQQRAFRPVGPAGLMFDDPAFPGYQWADTDGDGFADARFQELVDATDPDNPVSLLPKDGRYRWFIAARIEDLSGRLNVNVATDLGLDPANPGNTNFGVNDDYRLGMSPSDVDLKTFLTMLTAKQVYTLPDGQDGYSLFKQAGPGVYDDYTEYANSPPQALAASVGAFGYNGLAATIGLVQAPHGDQNLTGLPPILAQDRYEYYTLRGGMFTGETGYDSANSASTMAGIFGLPDLVELMTYRGINDPANRSRLEVAIGGRDWNNYVEFSPLRDNRSLEVERSWDTDNYGQVMLNGLMWSALDLRQFLTTISGARHLRSVRLAYEPSIFDEILRAGSALNGNGVNEEPINAQEALRDAAGDPDITRREPFTLLRGYGDSLLPFSGDLNAWDPNPGSSPFVTMFYGYNPEVALRIAGAMTANMVDLYDSDGTPSAYTLLFDTSKTSREAVAANATEFPWWSEGQFLDAANSEWSYSGRLDLDGFRELDSPPYPPDLDNPPPSRLADNTPPNIVTTPAINIYGIEAQPFITEVACFSMYTDSPQPGDGEDEGGYGMVTINGTQATPNDDFIFQCLAFQLNNPFDETITLGSSYLGSPNDVYNYYIEFGGQRYPLVSLNDDGSQSAATLDPGETRVFYFLSQPKAAIMARITSVYPGAAPDTLDRWIDSQLGVEFDSPVSPVRIPSDAGIIPSVQQLLVGAPGVDDVRNREARLWRVLRSSIDSTGTNDRANDLLADRIRDPFTGPRPTLDRRLPTGQQVVDNTIVVLGDDADDSGYSIVLWGSIRRPDDPRDPDQGGIVPRGALPAWCMERKFGAIGTSLNHRRIDGTNVQTLDRDDFIPEDPGDTTFDGMLTDQSTNVYNLLISLQCRAEDKNTYDPNKHVRPSDHQTGTMEYYQLYPEAHIENDQFLNAQGRPVIRPADLLLPLGVGPWYDPAAPMLDPDDPANELGDDRWTTLGESLAMALGYNNPPNTPRHEPFYNLYDRTDRGSLRLDNFVPFVDNDLDGEFDYGVEQHRGAGIPLALNILDVFTTLDPRYGSLNRATLGTINLNTAPEAVLRALSILSPPDDTDLLGAKPWPWESGSGRMNSLSDVAATIVAYRDKTRINPRGEVNNVSFVGDNGIPGYYNPDPTASIIEYYGRNNDLTGLNASDIPGLREQPGLQTRGEVMAARDRQFTSAIGNTQLRPHDIDRLGHDNAVDGFSQSTDRDGIDSVRYSGFDDQIQDDYDEKLAIANGIMNSVSVRSDIYAATFVIHGYQQADCDGLSDQDPLVPSIARRYLMIVDRSSVVRTGDKPRILVFKEMPLN
jgi:hypothetical protein